MSDEPSFEDVLAGMEDAMGEGDGSTSGQTGSGQGDGTGQGGSTGQYGNSQGGSGATAGPWGQGTAGSGGTGPLTPEEQVAILDGRLEQGTGEFDAMILEEQAQQRQATRSSAGEQAPPGASSGTGSAGDGSGQGTGVASRGSYGGGIGGAGGGDVPQNTTKYPPPGDIPNGNDDDVVARQLREAAMREPDPAVREKLWEEYRKYKGISK